MLLSTTEDAAASVLPEIQNLSPEFLGLIDEVAEAPPAIDPTLARRAADGQRRMVPARQASVSTRHPVSAQ